MANTAYYQPSPFEFEAEEIRYFLDWKHYSSHQLSLNPLLLRRRYRNRAFWCRGYYVDTVGKNSRIFLNEYKPQMVKQTSPPRISVACIAREHAVVIKTGVIG
ncbi:transposase [Escherichia coli]|uniref:transposase n=1 Tax=Escherichia coli TaxID=562 RepID=UPI0039184508